MRLWTLHPRYLDAKGLVAAWREALLAQKVLEGRTRGYTRHPQLARFRAHPKPLPAIAAFLSGLAQEARKRGYQLDTAKISCKPFQGQIKETKGQLLHEWTHLRQKLQIRSPELYRQFAKMEEPKPHPLFRIIPGNVRDWERAANPKLHFDNSPPNL